MKLCVTASIFIFAINSVTGTPIQLTKEKIKTLDFKKVGHSKEKIKLTTRYRIPKMISQMYFSGLVYRYDSRDMEQIQASDGFHPRQARGLYDPVLISDPERTISSSFFSDGVSSQYQTLNIKGIVSTSTAIYPKNTGHLTDGRDNFRYMIDTKPADIHGLDLDKTRMKYGLGKGHSYEVDFESPIPLSCIIGFFKKGENYKFYKNDEYTGYFDWNKEDVVASYDSATDHPSFTEKKFRLFRR